MQHHRRGCRDAPEDIHFIVVGRVGSDLRALIPQRLMYMNMHGRRRHLVFKFLRVNVLERRLQESQQERKNAEDDMRSPHSLH
jgi:hypothetical protein